MDSRFVSTMSQILIGAAVVAVMTMFAPPSSNGQGVKAAASPTTSKATEEPAGLQRQLQALEKRVVELEKEALDTADDASESDAAAAIVDQRLKEGEAAVKQLTQRVANAEKKAGDDKAGDDKDKGKTDKADDDSPMTVTAPFVVVDGSGKPIMRVVEADGTFSRGVYVYNDNGNSVAHVGVLMDGYGRMYVARPGGGVPAAQMGARPAGGVVTINNTSQQVVSLDRNALTFSGDANAPLAVFGTKDRAKGYLELNDSSGSKMVEAGMLNNHKGYVLANPYRPTADPHGDPSVLKGGGK